MHSLCFFFKSFNRFFIGNMKLTLWPGLRIRMDLTRVREVTGFDRKEKPDTDSTLEKTTRIRPNFIRIKFTLIFFLMQVNIMIYWYFITIKVQWKSDLFFWKTDPDSTFSHIQVRIRILSLARANREIDFAQPILPPPHFLLGLDHYSYFYLNIINNKKMLDFIMIHISTDLLLMIQKYIPVKKKKKKIMLSFFFCTFLKERYTSCPWSLDHFI